jgi:hypothetical protein
MSDKQDHKPGVATKATTTLQQETKSNGNIACKTTSDGDAKITESCEDDDQQQ